ncbi:hypothetical protein DsansV1_C06g0061521 [Dioscorea sansibarensis]
MNHKENLKKKKKRETSSSTNTNQNKNPKNKENPSNYEKDSSFVIPKIIKNNNNKKMNNKKKSKLTQTHHLETNTNHQKSKAHNQAHQLKTMDIIETSPKSKDNSSNNNKGATFHQHRS